jgi:hypothetical protein
MRAEICAPQTWKLVWKKATQRSSQCLPTSPIHRARRPIRDAAGSYMEEDARGESGLAIVLTQIQ